MSTRCWIACTYQKTYHVVIWSLTTLATTLDTNVFNHIFRLGLVGTDLPSPALSFGQAHTDECRAYALERLRNATLIASAFAALRVIGILFFRILRVACPYSLLFDESAIPSCLSTVHSDNSIYLNLIGLFPPLTGNLLIIFASLLLPQISPDIPSTTLQRLGALGFALSSTFLGRFYDFSSQVSGFDRALALATAALTPTLHRVLSIFVALALVLEDSDYDHEKEAFLSLFSPAFEEDV